MRAVSRWQSWRSVLLQWQTAPVRRAAAAAALARASVKFREMVAHHGKAARLCRCIMRNMLGWTQPRDRCSRRARASCIAEAGTTPRRVCGCRAQRIGSFLVQSCAHIYALAAALRDTDSYRRFSPRWVSFLLRSAGVRSPSKSRLVRPRRAVILLPTVSTVRVRGEGMVKARSKRCTTPAPDDKAERPLTMPTDAQLVRADAEETIAGWTARSEEGPSSTAGTRDGRPVRIYADGAVLGR